MKTLRRASWVSLVAVGQLVFASAAHAQAPAGPQPAQPYEPVAPPPGYPPPPAGYPTAAPPAGLAPPFGMAPLVAGPVVQLRSDNPRARLQTMQLKWRDVCMTPCGVPVDPNAVYRIGGGSIRGSAGFRMPRSAGTVLVTAETGSNVTHWVGIIMIASGAAAAAFGGLYWALGDDIDSYNDSNGFHMNSGFKTMGIVYIVAGIIAAGIGVPLAMSSTSVEVR